MVVMVIGLAALTSVSIERRSAQADAEFARARMYARSAIEMGYYWMRSDPNWRTTYANSTRWANKQPLGEGEFTLDVEDPDDGAIDAAPNNFVLMTGTGRSNKAQYILQVKLADDRGTLTVVPGSWTRIVQ